MWRIGGPAIIAYPIAETAMVAVAITLTVAVAVAVAVTVAVPAKGMDGRVHSWRTSGNWDAGIFEEV